MRPPLPIPAHNIGARGTYVATGTYTVTMEVDGAKETRTFEVRSDPTTPITAAEHKAREAFLLEVADVQARLTARTTEFRAKVAAATGAEQARLTALAQKLSKGNYSTANFAIAGVFIVAWVALAMWGLDQPTVEKRRSLRMRN